MPEFQLHDPLNSAGSDFERDTLQNADRQKYRIRRKGSRYNIVGPEGRIFGKYKSASVAGPRWEELTHTPWPYKSSAYESGTRLWQLGIIKRGQIGQRKLRRSFGGTKDSRSLRLAASQQVKHHTPVSRTFEHMSPILALPRPRINLEEQTRLIQTLRQNPRLLFNANVRQALRHEVEYHRPYAGWAHSLLKLLAKFDAQQRRRRQASALDSQTILARHIAWQEQRQKVAAGSIS